MEPLLDRIDAYCDAVPRRAARAEEHGPLVLFVRERPGWPYYARPRRGALAPTPADVTRVRARQRELGLPESFEWIADLTPELRTAVRAAGLRPADHPLLVLRGDVPSQADGVDVRLVDPDEDVGAIGVVAAIAFAHPGTAVGGAGAAELAAATARRRRDGDEDLRARLRSGEAVLAAAFLDGLPVATGMHLPLGDVTEIVGVGTLPAARRRGFGAAVTALLAADARARGVETVFVSAGDDDVARLYASLGFERAGTAGIAAPPAPA